MSPKHSTNQRDDLTKSRLCEGQSPFHAGFINVDKGTDMYYTAELNGMDTLTFFIGGGPGSASSANILMFGDCSEPDQSDETNREEVKRNFSGEQESVDPIRSNEWVLRVDSWSRQSDYVYPDVYRGFGFTRTKQLPDSNDVIAVDLLVFMTRYIIKYHMVGTYSGVAENQKSLNAGTITIPKIRLHAASYGGMITGAVLELIELLTKIEIYGIDDLREDIDNDKWGIFGRRAEILRRFSTNNEIADIIIMWKSEIDIDAVIMESPALSIVDQVHGFDSVLTSQHVHFSKKKDATDLLSHFRSNNCDNMGNHLLSVDDGTLDENFNWYFDQCVMHLFNSFGMINCYDVSSCAVTCLSERRNRFSAIQKKKELFLPMNSDSSQIGDYVTEKYDLRQVKRSYLKQYFKGFRYLLNTYPKSVMLMTCGELDLITNCQSTWVAYDNIVNSEEGFVKRVRLFHDDDSGHCELANADIQDVLGELQGRAPQ